MQTRTGKVRAFPETQAQRQVQGSLWECPVKKEGNQDEILWRMRFRKYLYKMCDHR